MSESLTPEAILTDASRGRITKLLAVDLLLSLIEKSNNSELRTTSIFTLQKLIIPKEKVEKVYETIESCLLSDENAFVRSSAAILISEQLLKYGIHALKWAIHHDSSPIVLNTLMAFFIEKPQISLELTECLQIWLKNYAEKIGIVPEEARFFLEVESLFAQRIKNYEISDDSHFYFRGITNMKPQESFFNISKNHIKVLHYNFYNWLYLKRNQDIITSFSKIQDLASFLSLYKQYDINFKDPPTLPSSIGRLVHLKVLNLSGNEIKSIPSYIFSLSNLQELDLSKNTIEKIPNSILKLKKLKVLNLKNNDLQDIPSELEEYLASLDKFEY
ncbi:MAG: leucine-rich repeat domain-containing protein, partial [Candidatus Thorarchaeota archaeon]